MTDYDPEFTEMGTPRFNHGVTHLPECPVTKARGIGVEDTTRAEDVCRTWGICDALRACEERVLVAADMPRSMWERELVSRTLDAARDAVAALTPMRTLTGVRTFSEREVLAAIDALKGEANENQ